MVKSQPTRRPTREKTLPPAGKSALAEEQSFRIVGLGASAGGLEAFEKFFSAMPPAGSMAFVIVQHLDPSVRSFMPRYCPASPACRYAWPRTA
jgi:two-component system CheB/CheR fusion protein